MKTLQKQIFNQDMFGHKIQMNFRRQGENKKTLIGGIFSILIKVSMLFYVIYNFRKLFLYEDDKNYKESKPLDL